MYSKMKLTLLLCILPIQHFAIHSSVYLCQYCLNVLPYAQDSDAFGSDEKLKCPPAVFYNHLVKLVKHDIMQAK